MIATIRAPDGTSTDNVAVRDSVGTYHYDVVPSLVGVYFVDWVGSGAIAAVDVDKFEVIARP